MFSHVWLCHPINGSPPGFSIHGIIQARILEWVAIPFSRGSSWPRDWSLVSGIAGWFFTNWFTQWNPTWKKRLYQCNWAPWSPLRCSLLPPTLEEHCPAYMICYVVAESVFTRVASPLGSSMVTMVKKSHKGIVRWQHSETWDIQHSLYLTYKKFITLCYTCLPDCWLSLKRPWALGENLHSLSSRSTVRT